MASYYGTPYQTEEQANDSAITFSYITGFLFGSIVYLKTQAEINPITFVEAGFVGVISTVVSGIICSMSPRDMKFVVPFIGGFGSLALLTIPNKKHNK